MINIPVITIQKETIPEAYESALIQLYERGIEIKTQYDGDNPRSKDATANITILNPLKQPMIHKAFPGGIEDLREYCMELKGCKNHWVRSANDTKDTRWEYTYNQRFSDWGTWYIKTRYPIGQTPKRLKINYKGIPGDGVNQIDAVINKLIEKPYTRQAQMITWIPFMDNYIYDPPCIQSLWYRLIENDNKMYLNCNVRIRSNDAWGAFFMNVFGIAIFNRDVIAGTLAKKMNKEIRLGRLNWQADSFHLYGKDIPDFEKRFYYRVQVSSIKDRTYNLFDENIYSIWQESEKNVITKIRKYDEEHYQE